MLMRCEQVSASGFDDRSDRRQTQPNRSERSEPGSESMIPIPVGLGQRYGIGRGASIQTRRPGSGTAPGHDRDRIDVQNRKASPTAARQAAFRSLGSPHAGSRTEVAWIPARPGSFDRLMDSRHGFAPLYWFIAASRPDSIQASTASAARVRLSETTCISPSGNSCRT
jgi:hypothetical protein